MDATATPPSAMTPMQQRIREILAEGRSLYGAQATERLEETFLQATGGLPRPLSPHPMQRPNLFAPWLEARPWRERSEFEGIAILEANWETIRDEVFSARERAFQRFDDGTPHSGDWNALYLRYGARPVEENRPLVPRSVEIANSLPRVGVMAMISALNPGAHIAPHCGVHNFRMTAHLGLRIPDGCTFRVAGETRTWREGECLVFDDSFEHEVWNRGTGTRYVLLIDFWHPQLTEAEVAVLDRIEALMASVRSRVTDGLYAEPVQWWV